MEDYLDGRHSSQKSAVYISVSWAESVSSEVLITRQWYVDLAGVSSCNLAFTLPDSVGWLFAHPEQMARSFPLYSWLLSSEGWRRGRATFHLKVARHCVGLYPGLHWEKRDGMGGVMALQPQTVLQGSPAQHVFSTVTGNAALCVSKSVPAAMWSKGGMLLETCECGEKKQVSWSILSLQGTCGLVDTSETVHRNSSDIELVLTSIISPCVSYLFLWDLVNSRPWL